MLPGKEPVDLLVVGGGINGVGIARDAAGRGLSVLLCEQDDLASGTSSASTKLIHGGLRYLEGFDLHLVRAALIEREVLLRAAPHIIWPLRFVLPHRGALRPAWMVRLGLFLYDHLAGGHKGRRERLPGSSGLDLRRDPVGAPLKEAYLKGFSYWDCWVEDSRLVVLNAMDARERGARILPRTRCTGAQRRDGVWRVTLEAEDGSSRTVAARALVNAAGPWVSGVLDRVGGAKRKSSLRLVKGSHIVVPRLSAGAQAYILQNDDRRVVFVIPYEGNFSVVGTTEVPYSGDLGEVRISPQEIDYLCAAVNRYFSSALSPGDVIWSYAGVRPLYDDASHNPSAVTRDYVFDLDPAQVQGHEDQPPLLSIFGGKITTYRRLAEHALATLLPRLGGARAPSTGPWTPGPWTKDAVLPGGDLPNADFEAFVSELRRARPWLPEPLARRYARAYGTRIETLLGRATSLADLGENLSDTEGGDLYEAEIDYLLRHEWASTAEDILWRRSKLGLHLSDRTRARLNDRLGGPVGDRKQTVVP